MKSKKTTGCSITIYVDDLTLAIVDELMKDYDCSQSAVFRSCVKIVKGLKDEAKEKQEVRA